MSRCLASRILLLPKASHDARCPLEWPLLTTLYGGYKLLLYTLVKRPGEMLNHILKPCHSALLQDMVFILIYGLLETFWLRICETRDTITKTIFTAMSREQHFGFRMYICLHPKLYGGTDIVRRSASSSCPCYSNKKYISAAMSCP